MSPKVVRKREPMRAAPKAKASKPAPVKGEINWEAVEADYIEGVDPGDGQPRHFPSQRDLCRKYGISPASVSKRSRLKDANGKDWDERRSDFQRTYQEKRKEAIVSQIVSKEVAFREATLLGAELTVRHCIAKLGSTLFTREGKPVSALPPDALTKISGALKNAQSIGLVSMVSDPDGKAPGEGGNDWTTMRKAHAGQIPIPGQEAETAGASDEPAPEGGPDA